MWEAVSVLRERFSPCSLGSEPVPPVPGTGAGGGSPPTGERTTGTTSAQHLAGTSCQGVADARVSRLVRAELEQFAGQRPACLCATWELAALGRCVCPCARDHEDEPADAGGRRPT